MPILQFIYTYLGLAESFVSSSSCYSVNMVHALHLALRVFLCVRVLVLFFLLVLTLETCT